MSAARPGERERYSHESAGMLESPYAFQDTPQGRYARGIFEHLRDFYVRAAPPAPIPAVRVFSTADDVGGAIAYDNSAWYSGAAASQIFHNVEALRGGPAPSQEARETMLNIAAELVRHAGEMEHSAATIDYRCVDYPRDAQRVRDLGLSLKAAIDGLRSPTAERPPQ